jgi:hypothetical protein
LKEYRMVRDETVITMGLSKAFKEGVRQFMERGFDWIAWLVITLIILSVLVFF